MVKECGEKFMSFYDDFDLEQGYDLSQIEYIDFFVPEGEKEISCCFTGHRVIPLRKKKGVLSELKSVVSFLFSKGITTFHAGGALGFDTLAATTIVDLKRTHPGMKLVLDLPYENQTAGWSDANKRIYNFIKDNADKVTYYSDNPENRDQAVKAMFKRNRVLVDSSSVCVCFCQKNFGGTAYTVEYAKKCDLEIYNLAIQ